MKDGGIKFYGPEKQINQITQDIQDRVEEVINKKKIRTFKLEGKD